MPVLSLYRLLFMAELFTAEFLYIFHLQKRRKFLLRFALCVIVGCGLSLLLPPVYDAFYTSASFVLLFVATLPMLKFCCDEVWINIFFCGVAAYTTQHFSYGLANFMMALIQWGETPLLGMYFEGVFDPTSLNLNTLFMALVYLLAYFVSYSLMYVVFGRRIPHGGKFKVKSTSVMIVVGAGFFVDIFLNMVVVYFGDSENILTLLMNTIYENLCCFFLLNIQFGLLKRGALENELDVMQYLLHEKEQQYNLSKESIALINLKCHDLRHEIRLIGEGKGLSDEAVSEIEGAISIYDAEVRTDNEVLDIILTEKSLKCARNGIALTCVADGHALDFMDKTDIYALFGNALDNAIEAVLGLPEEHRSIGVVVRQVGNIVSVNVHNTYVGTIKFDGEGLPVTRKDSDFHGFGMKSIRRICEKYHGTLTVTANDGIFALNMLISQKK